jgi:hypothetical protein
MLHHQRLWALFMKLSMSPHFILKNRAKCV